MGVLAASLKSMKMPLTWCCKNAGAKSHWKCHAGKDRRRWCDLAPPRSRVTQGTTNLGVQPVSPLTQGWAFRTFLGKWEKNPAWEILWWLKVPLKSEFWIVGRKPELTEISALYLGILERLTALRNLKRRTREVVQLKFTSRTPVPTKPKPLPRCSPRSCIYKSNTF